RRYDGPDRHGLVRGTAPGRYREDVMPGVWKKTLTYLGLVEDDEFEELDEVGAAPETAEVRRFQRPQAVREVELEPEHEGIVRTIPSSRPATAGSIHKSEPRRFNEARDIADRFKDGIPVIMNLQSTDDTIARRLVDFASGLVYGLDGKIEMVANRVYLLTPANVDVSAEDRERIAGGDLYNQF
ncbi:MAG TPA: cell division protein SepF, partial [Actinomycetota bacterium]|nr:cell division protein SepF [Actinomycetota bacterium]